MLRLICMAYDIVSGVCHGKKSGLGHGRVLCSGRLNFNHAPRATHLICSLTMFTTPSVDN